MAAWSCRSARARSAAYHAKPEIAVCPAPTAAISPSSRRSSNACSRAAIASRSRSVRYRSSDIASSRAGAGGGVVACVAQCGLVEGDGFPVGPGAGRLGRRCGRVPQHPGDVTGGGGVVGEHARVAADRLQRVDHHRMQGRFGTGRGRVQDRGPGDLVAKRHPTPVPVDQPGTRQHPDRRRRHVQGGQQLPTHRFRGAREQLQTAPGRRGQPGDAGQHRVPHARRQRGLGLSEDLTDEERVARCPAMHVDRIQAVPVHQRPRRPPGSAGSAATGARPGSRRDHPAPDPTDDRRPACPDRTTPATAATPRSGGPGTAPDPASPHHPNAGPPPRTPADPSAARPTPPRRSRAAPHHRPATPAPTHPTHARRHAADPTAAACSTSHTCPTTPAPAPAPAPRTHAAERSFRRPPHPPRAPHTHARRQHGQHGRRAHQGDARAPATAPGDRKRSGRR